MTDKKIEKMDAKRLRSLGGFVSKKGVKKNISWKNDDGQEFDFDVYIKRHPFGKIEELFLSKKDDEKIRNQMSEYIQSSIFFDEDCTQGFSFDDAYHLEPSLARAFIDAISETNKKKELTSEDEFLCELVMNGIGGKTIEEARQSLSYYEIQTWSLYRKKHGDFNLALRLEAALARIGVVIANSNGAKLKMEDFLPHIKLREQIEQEDREATLDDLKKIFGIGVK